MNGSKMRSLGRSTGRRAALDLSRQSNRLYEFACFGAAMVILATVPIAAAIVAKIVGGN